MKYLYRGHIYEATYFGTTSPFNLDLLADLHDTSEMILEFLQDWVSMYISELRKRLDLTTDYGIDSLRFYGQKGIADELNEFMRIRLNVMERLAKI